MRKILYIIICLLCGFIMFVLIDNKLYDPIKKHGELTTLFKSIGTITKDSYEDLIGFSLNGEIFDIFRYKTSGVILDSLYPNYGESWDGKIF